MYSLWAKNSSRAKRAAKGPIIPKALRALFVTSFYVSLNHTGEIQLWISEFNSSTKSLLRGLYVGQAQGKWENNFYPVNLGPKSGISALLSTLD